MIQDGRLALPEDAEYNLSRPDRTAIQRTAKQLSARQIDELVAAYRGGKVSTYELAKKYKVHRNTIAKHLKARGLVVGAQPMSAGEIERACELQAEGLSWNAIGAAMGRDPKTVKKAIS
jgi:DNA-binding CsgD family transcriptional regulator